MKWFWEAALKISIIELVKMSKTPDEIKIFNKEKITKHYEYGNTLLHYAIEYNNIELIKHIIKRSHPKEVNRKNEKNITPIELMFLEGYEKKLIKLLIDRIESIDCETHMKIIQIYSEMDIILIKKLIKKTNNLEINNFYDLIMKISHTELNNTQKNQIIELYIDYFTINKSCGKYLYDIFNNYYCDFIDIEIFKKICKRSPSNIFECFEFIDKDDSRKIKLLNYVINIMENDTLNEFINEYGQYIAPFIKDINTTKKIFKETKFIVRKHKGSITELKELINENPKYIQLIDNEYLCKDMYKILFQVDNKIIKYIPFKYHDDILKDYTIEL